MDRKACNAYLNTLGLSLQTVNKIQPQTFLEWASPSAVAVTYGWLEPYRISANPDLTGVKLGPWHDQSFDFRHKLKASLVDAAKNHPLYKGDR